MKIDYNGVSLQRLAALGVVTGANNGLSISTVSPGVVVLGQNVGQAGNPAILLSTREIPLGGFSLAFKQPGTLPTANLIPVFLFTDNAGTEMSRITIPGNQSFLAGKNAGAQLTGDTTNIGIGNSVFQGITTGASNIGIGSGAMQGNTGINPNFCIGIGQDVLDKSGAAIGDRNIVIGHNSISSNAASPFGTYNIIIGMQISGGSATAGPVLDNNIIIGSRSNIGGSITNSIVLAAFNNAGSLYTLSNTICLGTSTQNLLIGQAVTFWTDNGSRVQISGSISLPIVSTAVNLTVDATMNAIVATASVTLTMPTVAAALNRDYYLVAQGASVITTSVNYTNLAGVSVNTVPAGTAVKIRSNGTIYIQIR